MADKITWLGHDTFRIDAGVVIYTDPFQLAGGPTADIILITHEHRDHCSPDDVAKIVGPGTVIVATPDCGKKLGREIVAVAPGDTVEVKGIEIKAVAAYNTNKKFHPKENKWVGYVFKALGKTIYLAGDTDRIEEMKDIKCDIALLPVSGTYVMTAEEAVGAALDIKPSLAIPMHYGSIVGTAEDAGRFAEALKGRMDVKIMTVKQ